jgi:hypothetical protein
LWVNANWAQSNFPEFMKHPANRISSQRQYAEGIEGYVSDGADGSRMALWIFHDGGIWAEHVPEDDEYFVAG